MLNEKQCYCNCGQKDPRFEKVMTTIEEHRDMKGSLIPVLHSVQELYGFLPEDVLKIISEELSIPMTEIYGVASFYSIFSLKPKGKNVIKVCLGTACYVKGSQAIIERLTKELNVEVGKTTEDGMFTLEATRCLGACGLAPVMMICERVYGRLIPDDIPRILAEFK